MNFAMGQVTPPPRAAAAECYPMTPEAGGRLAARGRPTKVERHAGIGFELVAALDAPVLQMVDQLVDVLQTFDTFPVVAEQVTAVPKIMLEDNIPQRTALREPQLVEQLVEVPTEPVFVEQTVDIPVPVGGRLRLCEGLLGLRRGQVSAACARGGPRFSPWTGFKSVILSFSLPN